MRQGELGRELQAVRHLIVKVHKGGEAVVVLLDDGARLSEVAERNAVFRLVAAACDVDGIVVGETVLGHFIHPVGIVVKLFVFRESGIVVEFRYVAGVLVLAGIEVGLLHQHGVVVAGKHLAPFRLAVAGELIEVLHPRRALHAALGADHDHTVGTARAVDGSRGPVFQHRDLIDILGIDAEKVGKLLGCGVGIVEGAVYVALIWNVVEHDEWLRVGVDGAGAADTHR